MNNILRVFRFGKPYLQRYWTRLACGVALGILFGLSNAAILGVSKGLLDRVFPPEQSARVDSSNHAGLRGRLDRARDSLQASLDPYLPMAGRPLTPPQAVGLLVL